MVSIVSDSEVSIVVSSPVFIVYGTVVGVMKDNGSQGVGWVDKTSFNLC